MVNNYINQTIDILTPTFRAFSYPPRVNNVDFTPSYQNIQAPTPTLRYTGADAGASTWTAWDYGDTLSVQSVSVAPTLNTGSPLYGQQDDSVKFNNSDYYAASASTTGNITTEDFMIEALIWTSDDITSTQHIIDKYNTDGWKIYTSGGNLSITIHGNGGADVTLSGAVLTNAWYHVVIACNRDYADVEAFQLFINGWAVDTADASGSSGSLSNASNIIFGAAIGGGSSFGGAIAYFCLWIQSDWFLDNSSYKGDLPILARLMSNTFQGSIAEKAEDTAILSIGSGRNSAAYLDKYVDGSKRLFMVGEDWPRVCYRRDLSNTDAYGYLSEQSKTNLFLYSNDCEEWSFNNVVAGRAGDAYQSVEYQRTNGNALVADGTNDAHYIEQAITLTAVRHVFSVWAKQGNRKVLELENSTLANVTTTFDLDSGSILTEEASVLRSDIESWGGGWYRCSIQFTGTVASHTFRIHVLDNDESDAFIGDGTTPSIYLFGIQCEVCTRNQCPTSFIETQGTTVTRNADDTRYKAVLNIGGDSVRKLTTYCKTLFPISDGGGDYTWLLNIKAGSGNDRAQVYVLNDGTGAVGFSSRHDNVTNMNIAGTTNIRDGNIHLVRGTIETDDGHLYIDNAEEGTPDTSCNLMDGLTQIWIAQYHTSAWQPDGLIFDIKLFPKPTKK
jgi:hypothetical protein